MYVNIYIKYNVVCIYFQNHSLKPIIPPLMLLSRDFIKNYANKQDVLNSGDLSEMPSMNTPCITVLVQDITLYNLNEDE